jgi:hypothetical protein
MPIISFADFKRQLKNVLAKGNDARRMFKKNRYLRSDRIPWSKGYNEYKYDFIGEFIESEEISSFSKGMLPSGYGYRMDERFVEYPWFFSRIKDDERIILDAGSVLNFSQILKARKLRGKHLYIATLAYEGRPLAPISPSYIYEDLRDTCFRDSFFDAVCSLSTVEHIGLDNTILYTSDKSKRENDRFSYLLAVVEFRRILKEGGTLYLSVPYGLYRNHGWFQLFDSEMVNRLIETFNPAQVQATYFKYEHDQWNFSDAESCRTGEFFDIRSNNDYEPDYLAGARCVVCLEMTKGPEK